MAFKRKRTTKPRRTTRTVRRRTTVPRNIPVFRRRHHMLYYKRKFWLENWAPNNTTTSGFWRRYNLSFGNLPNYTDLSNLFEYFRISKIKLTFLPAYDSFAGNDNSDTGVPGITFQTGTYCHVLNDPKSQVNPSGVYGQTSLQSFMEQGNVKSRLGIRPFKIYYTPAIVVESVANKLVGPRFLPISAVNQTHFGPQVYMQLPNFTGALAATTWMQNFDVFVTMYVTVKGMT